MTRLRDRGRYVIQAGAAIATHPAEGVERVRERVGEWRDVRRGAWHNEPATAWEEDLRRLLPTLHQQDLGDFERVWGAALSDLHARGLQTGRGAYGGWDDADLRLGRLAWSLVRALQPDIVVETGVARGLTTRILLEAMQRNGAGRLWSIDLPPLIREELAGETGAAVPSRLHDHWTLVAGSSRRRLPQLVHQLPRVDLFVHDSMHTTRNVRFELACIWPVLRPGGAALIDDVERNRATGEFLAAHRDADGVVCRADDGRALIAVMVKRPGERGCAAGLSG